MSDLVEVPPGGDVHVIEPKPATLLVLADDDEVVKRTPALRGHVIAFVVGQPGTAQIHATPALVWERLAREVGPIRPADGATAALLGPAGLSRLKALAKTHRLCTGQDP